MRRDFLIAAALFLAPFILSWLWGWVRPRSVTPEQARVAHRLLGLTFAGLLLAVLGLVLLGSLAERHQGAYVPAHMENGRLVPGKME